MKLLFVLSAVFLIGASAAPATEQKYAMIMDDVYGLHYVPLTRDIEEAEPNFNVETDVFFNLYTRANPTGAGQPLRLNDISSITNSNFNPAHPTRFTIHGWNGAPSSSVNIGNTREYLARGDFNCITVDWSIGAGTINYIAARNSVNDVGPYISRFIEFLNVATGHSFSQVNIIGHSLGGHVAGLAGKNLNNGRVHAVIALDPAGPLFSFAEPSTRVAPTDADYVEVIHTNGGLLGFDLPIGQADFYPNGGRSQPGCGADIVGTCAHERVNTIFTESINGVTGFVSTRCANYEETLLGQCTPSGPSVRMGGEPSNTAAEGVYFLTTNAAAPFAQG